MEVLRYHLQSHTTISYEDHKPQYISSFALVNKEFKELVYAVYYSGNTFDLAWNFVINSEECSLKFHHFTPRVEIGTHIRRVELWSVTYPRRNLANRRIPWRQKLPNLVSLKMGVGHNWVGHEWKEYLGSDIEAVMLWLEMWQVGQKSQDVEVGEMD
jgi:hypothetical protein